MSAKFKPKKKKVEPIVDDWEASDADIDDIADENIAEGSNLNQNVSSTPINEISQDAWGDDIIGITVSAQSKQNGMALWEQANRAAPQAQPVVTNRSLPSTVFSPRLVAPSSSDHQHSTVPPPPQILRREKAGYGTGLGANDKGNEKKKTLKEREEEYRKARERIFGSTSAAASSESQANSSRPGSASGHSSGSGKHQQQQQKGQTKTKS